MDGNRSEKPNLIGISGKIGHGKDLIGEIIQYLSCYDQLEPRHQPFENFRTAPNMNRIMSGWEVKKFADKLKDITCMLLGCTREQLEDREFKGSILGDEWTKYGIAREFSTRVIDVQGTIEEAEERLSHWGKGCKVQKMEMTPRLFMQLLGTEAGREILHPNIWVNALFADYTCIHCGQTPCSEGHNSVKGGTTKFPKWIITDVRFPNEAKAVIDHGGILIRVERPSIRVEGKEHASETGLDDYKHFDYTIINNGTIEDLIEKVRNLNLV